MLLSTSDISTEFPTPLSLFMAQSFRVYFGSKREFELVCGTERERERESVSAIVSFTCINQCVPSSNHKSTCCYRRRLTPPTYSAKPYGYSGRRGLCSLDASRRCGMSQNMRCQCRWAGHIPGIDFAHQHAGALGRTWL